MYKIVQEYIVPTYKPIESFVFFYNIVLKEKEAKSGKCETHKVTCALAKRKIGNPTLQTP